MARYTKRQPVDPEEIVARALCHGDPEAETAKGPLWTTYRKDARRVLEALGPRVIADDWLPTSANINALATPLRRYVMHLATHSDPQMTIQENFELREQVRQIEAMIARERAEPLHQERAKKARPPRRQPGSSAPPRRC